MLIRLMTTKGMAMLTFTPLMGWTKVVESFYPEKRTGSRPEAPTLTPAR
jgi:phage terminase large subunit-like protein